jgi:AcrR family transcriptional regulator
VSSLADDDCKGREAIDAKREVKRSTRSQRTRDRLLQAGESVFSERGFHSASVSEICQRAGLANGTFYRHFEDKVDIFAALVARLQEGMCDCIARAAETTDAEDEALIRAYRDVLAFVAGGKALYLVGRSAESMQMGIHRHFRASLARALALIIQRGIQAARLRPVDPETAAYALLGIIEFAVMRYILWEPESLTESVLQTFDALILKGYDTAEEVTPSSDEIPEDAAVTDEGERAPEPEGGEATRQSLLSSAERLFGQAGFHQTAISGITYLSGVAQGTFYLHFPSKVAILAELVREINQRFREEEHKALSGVADRREMERVGFRTFFRFIGVHRGAYRILREAELVDPASGRWYYERLAKGYIRGLRGGMDRGEIRALAVEPLAYALLGIGHSVALWALTDAEAGVERVVSEATLCGLMDILENGLAFEPA